MKNFSERCIIHKEHFPGTFSIGEYIKNFSLLCSEPDMSHTWIRSGIHIPAKYKNIISSYRLQATCRSAGGSVTEVLAVKGQVGVKLESMEKECVSFICDYLLHSSADAAAAVFTSLGEDGYMLLMIRSPRFASFSVPEDILSFMCTESIKNYLRLSCSLTKSALDGYFSPTYLLYDDSVIKNKARAIDKALSDLKFCDIAASSGSAAKAMCLKVASVRMSLNKYLEHNEDRSESSFTKNFIENSLYASDSSVGALDTLRMELYLTSDKYCVKDGHFMHGSILTENLFKGMIFDIIVSAPPHMRQELFSQQKPLLKEYKSAETSSDLYCYYIERAMSLLSDKGTMSLITSNRWMRSSYGAPIRELLSSADLLSIVDYASAAPISEFNTSISVITAGKSAGGPHKFSFVTADEKDINDLSLYAAERSKPIDITDLNSEKWLFNSDLTSDLICKIEALSVPLSQYVSGRIYRGILTGLNKAFIVDEAHAKTFIEKNSNNRRILRPFLSGRDVKRFAKPEIKQYLIFIPKGYTDKMRGVTPPLEWLAMTHREIALHLSQYEDIASKRSDKGTYWWELRSCKYYDEFENTKIICPSIVKHLSATMDTDALYSNDKTLIIGSDDIFLLGVLNSSLADFYFRKSANELLNDHFELKPGILGKIPIRSVSPTNSRQVRLRDEIASAAKELCAIYKNCPSKKSAIFTPERVKAERELNSLVFQLYKLTPSEISLVENY